MTLAVMATVGYGFNDSNATGVNGGEVLDMYGVGVGGRAGWTFDAPFRAYVGASYLHCFGFSSDVGSGHVDPLGVEVGYDFTLGRFTLRPFFGVGIALYGSRAAYEIGSGKKAALWPGLLGTYDLTEHVFAGVEIRYTVVPRGVDSDIVAAGGGSTNALGVYADVGVRF